MTTPTILLIDDDPTLLEALSSHLQTAGYRPLTARDGASGLKLVEESAPDLVVLDVMMPNMNGWEVCERLRQRSHLPIIMLTAKGEEIDKLRGFRLRRGRLCDEAFLICRVGRACWRRLVSRRTLSFANSYVDE